MFKFFKNVDLTGYTVIIPSVSVGNVGQFSVDLLISTLKMDKVAMLHSPAFVPVVGYNPYDLFSDSLSTACELFTSDSKKLAALQLRSPLLSKYRGKFLKELIEKFKELNASTVITITSSFAHECHNMSSSPFRYIANEFVKYGDKLNNLHCTEHAPGANGQIIIHGGGFSTELQDLCTSLEFPCLLFFKYCSEGDNIPDAIDTVVHLNSLLDFLPDHKNVTIALIEPPSWTLLFGSPPPLEIY